MELQWLICLEEYDKVLTVTRRVKGQSTKIPVPWPEIIKGYNSGMGGVDLLDQKAASYKLAPSHPVGVITLDYF